MAGFRSLLPGPLGGRGRGQSSKLPRYEKLNSPTKERFSDDYSDYSADDSDSCPPSSGPSTGQSSRVASGSTPILARRKPQTVRQRVRRLYPYRLPNRAARYLCFILLGSIVIMILSLVRASQVENARIAQGHVNKPPPPPPVWERFQLLTRYYGGVRTLVPFKQNMAEYPRAEENMPVDQANISTGIYAAVDLPPSKAFATDYSKSIFRTKSENVQECFVDAEKTVRVPSIRYYDGRPNAFPEHVLGSYEVLDLPEDICLDRFGRYGPYGMGYSARQGGLGMGEAGDTQGSEEVWSAAPEIDFRTVDWADAQRRCFKANSARYAPIPTRKPEPHGFYIGDEEGTGIPRHGHDRKPGIIDEPVQQDESVSRRDLEGLNITVDSAALESVASEDSAPEKPTSGDPNPKPLPRTAVVLRCWDEYEWAADDILFVRALISELSLASGGRYDVHILVHVKDDGKHPIWAENEEYEKVIRDRVPREFRAMVTLWTTTQMLAVYQGIYDLWPKGPDLPVHGAYRGLQMALQHFATKHPEYEYFWQWEMDIRYTGHYLDFFSKTENWARQQSRKGLWERSARFYVPSVHGSWEDFKQMTRVQAEMGTTDADNVWKGIPGTKDAEPPGSHPAEKIVWGPERPADEADWFEYDSDPNPPATYEQDRYEWGVGEEADLISFNPIFDPEGTTWGLADDITGYNISEGTPGKPPRRAHIGTASRLSRRLLMNMHRETVFKKHFAFTEMWPATVALHHGFKAVYAPHPAFVEREWPMKYFSSVLNGGRNGASGGARASVFGQREHNLHGLTWFYRSNFSAELYRAWMGLSNKFGAGSADFETKTDASKDGSSVENMRGGEGRMCLPPMLIHPVKDVFIPVEAPPDEEMVSGGDGQEAEFDAGS